VREQVSSVASDPRVRRALSYITSSEPAIEADQVKLSLIAAPPFAEERRASAFAVALRESGFQPTIDSIGNVIAAYERIGPNPVVVGAHLDTVFPISTPLSLRRKGRILYLPGIADNGSGLITLLWVFRVAKEAGIRFRRPVMLVGNVGEEGEGNLRGIRHLFSRPPWGDQRCEFIAIDVGGPHRLTQQALGSRRIRIRMKGPGGHSWADFGRPNPVHAISSLIHAFTNDNAAGRRPGTSFNVGMLSGGISVNAIPAEATAQVDLRSVQRDNIDELDRYLRMCTAEIVRKSGVDCELEVIGERPSGQTPVSHRIIQAAIEATRYFGVEPHLDIGSTDANIPMSLGIPAIAVGAGGSSGNIHTPDEWFDPTNRSVSLHRLLVLVTVLAGLD
jgi:tripeptide aminopeptidase